MGMRLSNSPLWLPTSRGGKGMPRRENRLPAARGTASAIRGYHMPGGWALAMQAVGPFDRQAKHKALPGIRFAPGG